MDSKTTKIIIIALIIAAIVFVVAILSFMFLTSKDSQVAEENIINQADNLEVGEEEGTVQSTENASTDLIDELTNTEVSSFNAKFTSYEGDSIKGTNVNALLQVIRSNNEQDEEHQVRAMANVSNWDYDNNQADAQSNYKITCEKDNETGYINVIKIEDANN